MDARQSAEKPQHEAGIDQAIFDERPTRPFFRWVQAQGRSPDASGGSKNASVSVGIHLKGVPQAINLTPSKRVKAWEDAPTWDSWKLTVRHRYHTVRWKASARNRGWLSFSVRDLYRLSLTLMPIRRNILPVSLHHPETFGSYVPCRSCSSSNCVILGITLLS